MSCPLHLVRAVLSCSLPPWGRPGVGAAVCAWHRRLQSHRASCPACLRDAEVLRVPPPLPSPRGGGRNSQRRVAMPNASINLPTPDGNEDLSCSLQPDAADLSCSLPPWGRAGVGAAVCARHLRLHPYRTGCPACLRDEGVRRVPPPRPSPRGGGRNSQRRVVFRMASIKRGPGPEVAACAARKPRGPGCRPACRQRAGFDWQSPRRTPARRCCG